MFRVVANWKMNISFSECEEFLGQFLDKCSLLKHTELIIAPPYPMLPMLSEQIHHSSVFLAAQNAHWEISGPFTGEVSPLLLKELGCSHLIVGHSERRQYFGETDEQIKQKASTAVSLGMVPIVCIGEDYLSYQSGKTKDVLFQQLKLIGNMDPLWLAYEPIWAIGSGAIPGEIEISDTARMLKNTCPQARILYGGSVNLQNLGVLSKVKELDGFLVGGLSVKFAEFFDFLSHIDRR